MSIRELMEGKLEQECGCCGAVRIIAETEIAIGSSQEGQTDTRVIPLPACADCGAVEYLIGSAVDEPEHPSPGSFGHLHRMLVDVLHSRLLAKGLVATGISPETAAGKEITENELNTWFGGTLRLYRTTEDAPEQTGEETSVETGDEQ